MAKFQYTIVDQKGNLTSGNLISSNRETAMRDLIAQSQKIVSLEEIVSNKKWWQMSFGHLGQKELILITRRISSMTKHGFSVIDSLRSIELQAQNPILKEVIEHIRSRVELGNTLADSLKEYPRYFSSVYVSIVRVGEESGKLAEVLQYLERQQTQIYELKKKAFAAMIYPLVIISLMIIIATGMILFLIPFLKDIFSSFSAELPLPTRIMMQTEPILKQYWWALLAGGLALYGAGKMLFKQSGFAAGWDKILMHIPLFGGIIKSFNVAQIIRTFATLNQSGVPITTSLEILTTVPNNSHYKAALEMVEKEVKKGSIFSAALGKHTKLFPPLVIESIKLGERTGNLTDSSVYLAELYEEEVKDALDTLTTLIQPLLMVLVGAMVAGFAISVILPLQRLPQLIQQSQTHTP